MDMRKYRAIATRIYEKLKDNGVEIGNASILIIEKILRQGFESQEKETSDGKKKV